MPDIANSKLIFISHSGEDTWIARQIAVHIERSGARSFLDEADVAIGAEFEDELLEFLEKADELLVLATPWAFERPYVWAEIGAAWLRRIPIVRSAARGVGRAISIIAQCTDFSQEA